MSGKRFALARALKGSTALLGPMTSAERSKGRYMRAPDGHEDAEFAAFEAAGEVEVGKPEIESNVPEEKPVKPAKPAARAAAKPAADKDTGKDGGKPDGAEADKDAAKTPEAGGEEEGEEEDEGEEEPTPKPRRTAKERIAELTGKTRNQERVISQLSQRLEALENGGLPAGTRGSNSAAAEKAPDPTDTEKYPLGHLDDRYIEDKLEYLAAQKAGAQADAVLQRQQEREQNERAEAARAELLEKVDDLSTRGSELFEDFQETVVEAGLAGRWDLSQATFEAAHEAEHGAQILYDLASDKKEATRVAKLSPFGQLKYVMDRNAEIAAKAKPRTKPGAGEPPQTRTRGANSSNRIDPATDSLSDFEKAWLQDEKANG